MPAHKKYSQEDDELLKSMYISQDLSCEKIARKLGEGHTKDSIESRVRRLNLKKIKPISIEIFHIYESKINKQCK